MGYSRYVLSIYIEIRERDREEKKKIKLESNVKIFRDVKESKIEIKKIRNRRRRKLCKCRKKDIIRLERRIEII